MTVVPGVYRYAGKLVTLGDLAECAERELLRRKRVFPVYVQRKRMRPRDADWGIALMAAIAERLRDEEKAELLV
jgi:hypothetical protein